jgi:hypothetical protein
MQNAYRLFSIVEQFPSFFRRMALKVIIWCQLIFAYFVYLMKLCTHIFIFHAYFGFLYIFITSLVISLVCAKYLEYTTAKGA